MSTFCVNKKASYDYEILVEYEAGLVLFGYEVKSIKSGRVSLKGSFIRFQKKGQKNIPEPFLVNASIPIYKYASGIDNYKPERSRKLLLHKKEIKKLLGKTHEQGLTLIPLKIYTKNSFLKLKFALARGKKKHDKRELIKKRDISRKIQRAIKLQN